MKSTISIIAMKMLETNTRGKSELQELSAMDLSFDEKVELIRNKKREITERNKIQSKVRYQEYLKSAVWDKKRKAVLKRANYTCEGCGEKNNSLEVHHLTYERKGMELLTDLVAYCSICHQFAHGNTNTDTIVDWHMYLHSYTDYKPKELKDMNENEKMAYILKMIED